MFLSGDTPTLNWTPQDHLSQTIVTAFEEQCAIGWEHIFLGRLSMKWKHAQHLHMTKNEPEGKQHRSAQAWAKDLCQRLMHIALNRWQIRNEAYQDSKSTAEYNRERQELITIITERYSRDQPDHPAVNRLFKNVFADLVTGTNSTMTAWKKSYDLVMKLLRPSLITTYLG